MAGSRQGDSGDKVYTPGSTSRLVPPTRRLGKLFR